MRDVVHRRGSCPNRGVGHQLAGDARPRLLPCPIDVGHDDPVRTRQRQARIGRNPKTGARVEVPSKRIPYFKPSKELKDLVNGPENGSGGTPPAV